jgi:hypothetical protein
MPSLRPILGSTPTVYQRRSTQILLSHGRCFDADGAKVRLEILKFGLTSKGSLKSCFRAMQGRTKRRRQKQAMGYSAASRVTSGTILGLLWKWDAQSADKTCTFLKRGYG